ncbi:MAG: methyltransferase domain-containing protein [Cyanothece sp. SIO2G6]|nr:methyltransferase domain-containing protein [Cyanothece sp. SIO2G6]
MRDLAVMEESDRIAANFGKATSTYHAQAYLQQHCAQQFLDLLDTSLVQQALPPGPVLEIGCGTGFITELLCDRLLTYPSEDNQIEHLPTTHTWHGRDYYITDLSEEMVQFCCDRLQPKLRTLASIHNSSACLHRLSQFHFHTLNAETLQPRPCFYSLILGSFVAQWFQNIESTIQQLLDQLKPGGQLLLSFPGHKSFPEWRQQCDRLDLPFTAHPLPNPRHLLQTLALSPQQYQVQIKTEWYPTYHKNTAAFFRSIKAIGASMSRANIQLTPSQMRFLLHQWQSSCKNSSFDSSLSDQIKVQYQIIYLLFIKQ